MDEDSLEDAKCCKTCRFFGSIDGEYGYCKENEKELIEGELRYPDCYSDMICNNWKE